MAKSSKGYLGRPNCYRFLPTDTNLSSTINMASDSAFEFEFQESDLYNSGPDPRNCEPLTLTHASPHRMAKKKSPSSSSSSLPLNIPDWSKILGHQYVQNRRRDSMAMEDDVDEESDHVPPHEFLANTRVAPSSVHEGVGRTLKGRDLSRLRNAIWAKTGFQD